MRRAIDETDRRRRIQVAYNEENQITPQSIIKPIDMSLARIVEADYVTVPLEAGPDEPGQLSQQERERYISELEAQMKEAARKFEFERAAKLRDRIKALKSSVTNDEVPVYSAGERDPS
jgi:excinuclease ABC subunit B